MASKPSSSRPPATSTSSVRRNLFHHHLSRRPTSTSTSTSATTLQESAQDDSSEIAVRDLNGDYQVQILRLPPMDDDQAQEDEVTEKESTSAANENSYKLVANTKDRVRGQIARNSQE